MILRRSPDSLTGGVATVRGIDLCSDAIIDSLHERQLAMDSARHREGL